MTQTTVVPDLLNLIKQASYICSNRESGHFCARPLSAISGHFGSLLT
jgi:hypothetical protein